MVDVCLYVIGHLGMGPQFLYGIVPPCVGCFTRQDIVLPDGGINDSLIQFEYLSIDHNYYLCPMYPRFQAQHHANVCCVNVSIIVY